MFIFMLSIWKWLVKWSIKVVMLTHRVRLSKRQSVSSLVATISFLPSYYRLNDLLWQDGLLIDFLQKKVIDKWIRRFLVVSSYLFSERVLFEIVVRFYIDLVIWPSTKYSLFDFSNVAMTLIGTVAALTLTILLFNTIYLYTLFF